MSGKFVLTVTFLVLMWAGPCLAFAQPVSPQRADELYIDHETTLTCPNCNCRIPRANCYGWRGQPYRDQPPGGCRCGKKCGLTYYNVSTHWPSPMSVLLDHGHQGTKWRHGTDTTHPRLRDKLDVLANIRLLPPVRKDNGYCGPFCDPYGLPGQSRRGTVVDVQRQEVAPSQIPAQARLNSGSQQTRLSQRSPTLASSTGQPTRLDRAAQLWHSKTVDSLDR